MAEQPLAEIFGFPIDNFSEEAETSRREKRCPYNNRVRKCTKDKADDPLGVCSIHHGSAIAITCPVRFRENWMIVRDATQFFLSQAQNRRG